MAVFYPTIPATHVRSDLPAGIPVMLTAASHESHARRRGTLKPAIIPSQVPEIAVDPGGFVAATHGGYKFTWPTYIDWLHSLGPRLTWAAFPDLPCEQELASDAYAVRARQEQTLRWVHEFWGDEQLDLVARTRQPWAWVPTIQGRTIAEYVWMAEYMADFLATQALEYDWMAEGEDIALVMEDEGLAADEIQQIRAWGRHCHLHRRIGIGSLCQRPANEIAPIVRAISEILPGERFHLWGIDMRALRKLSAADLMTVVASFDSSTYNGRFKGNRQVVDAERKRLGMTQAEHAVTVLIRRRSERVERILEADQAQLRLDLEWR